MCGADSHCTRQTTRRSGSPPRVRSRPPRLNQTCIPVGITSACAEQTKSARVPPGPGWDHLRVCGADTVGDGRDAVHWGSPPRVRSRHDWFYGAGARVGITSACAEQTPLIASSRRPSWDHLRVCGADLASNGRTCATLGSPPRVRSRQSLVSLHGCAVGITSACAEQTSPILGKSWLLRDHLRVCGADKALQQVPEVRTGSPPRVRSRPWNRCCPRFRAGITSACAEQTQGRASPCPHPRDHLRVCGADIIKDTENAKLMGSPPRVRSRLVVPFVFNRW